MRSIVTLSLLALVPTIGCANLHEVEPGRFYRSSQLSEAGFRDAIEDFGIRTVLRLRGGNPGDEGYDAIRRPADEAGATFEHVPMSARRLPPPEVLVRIWEVFDRAEEPILVHCKAGADRTGLASAIWVLHETGDLRRAKRQLDLRYLHVGWGSTDAMDQVLELYEPWAKAIDFGLWAQTVYDPEIAR